MFLFLNSIDSVIFPKHVFPPHESYHVTDAPLQAEPSAKADVQGRPLRWENGLTMLEVQRSFKITGSVSHFWFASVLDVVEDSVSPFIVRAAITATDNSVAWVVSSISHTTASGSKTAEYGLYELIWSIDFLPGPRWRGLTEAGFWEGQNLDVT